MQQTYSCPESGKSKKTEESTPYSDLKEDNRNDELAKTFGPKQEDSSSSNPGLNSELYKLFEKRQNDLGNQKQMTIRLLENKNLT